MSDMGQSKRPIGVTISAGILILVTVVIVRALLMGRYFDYYTHKDYWRLIVFLMKSHIDLVSLTILTPFPGSRIYEQLKKEGRITTHDWRKYDSLQHVVFKPKHMSAFSLQMWFVAVRMIGLLVSPVFVILVIQSVLAFFIFYYFSRRLLLGF